VDLLLVAYDGSQFYRAFDCASDALKKHELDVAALQDSEGPPEAGVWARGSGQGRSGRGSDHRRSRKRALTTRSNPDRPADCLPPNSIDG
jgi:hypothetical protein